jgi:hypothetical protein
VAWSLLTLVLSVGFLGRVLINSSQFPGPRRLTWWDGLEGGLGLLFLVNFVVAAGEALFAFGFARKPWWWRF